mmetsp:Transcript_16458/g.56036  ORF Transcript_16458/g.56036 Transcript_16458/m.56036 type:complete len:247 (-) Transcript_16458:191-931(-)
MSACLPLSRKYSAMAAAEYGARNCSGAGSEAVAATTSEYLSASLSSRIFTSCATVERFWPTATYTQYSFLLSSGLTLMDFWLRKVSIAMAVLPVWRSPMMSSRWPRPIGTSESTALMPVCIGSCTDLRAMMPGAFTSTRWRTTSVSAPLPSMGTPSASTTRPSMPAPTGTSTMAPVRFTMSPSLICVSEPKHTTPTLSFSRLSAMPFTPEANSTISPAWILFRPNTRAIPSPTLSTRPISSTSIFW